MNLSLLLPGALAALAALALPLLIHLARRSEPQRIDFAALRWLESAPRPRHRLRLEERALLAARLLLIALLALWLAQPVLFGAGDVRPFIAVMPGVSREALGTLPPDARAHWLAPGFPVLDQTVPDTTQPIASLLRQLDAELDPQAPLTVLATAAFDGADAQIPRLARAVDWRIAQGEAPAPQAATEPEMPALHLIADAAHAGGARYLQAAAAAWREGIEPPARHDPEEILPTAGNLTFVWLAEGELPQALRERASKGATILVAAGASLPEPTTATALWRDAKGAPLAEGAAFGKGRIVRFTRALSPEAMPELLDPGFPDRLRALLLPERPQPVRADARIWRPLDGAAPWPETPRDLRSWLALAIALAFALERGLAAHAPRKVPA